LVVHYLLWRLCAQNTVAAARAVAAVANGTQDDRSGRSAGGGEAGGDAGDDAGGNAAGDAGGNADGDDTTLSTGIHRCIQMIVLAFI